ncbi:hypothetical protein Bbelb_002070 [Branchiostoma belcheri]|nr:hypothetical protein Bbelb_002070 [Branchiostoma belcheri]
MAEAPPPKNTNILILGHSFVARLHSFLQRRTVTASGREIDQSFWCDNCSFTFRFVPGCTVRYFDYSSYLWDELPRVDIVYLELGCNDLCNTALSPEEVAYQLTDLALALKNKTEARQITVGLPLKRIFDPPGIPYNDRCERCVYSMIDLISRSQNPGLTWWSHNRILDRYLPSLFQQDGLHFSDYGNFLYFKSIRGAILKALDSI